MRLRRLITMSSSGMRETGSKFPPHPPEEIGFSTHPNTQIRFIFSLRGHVAPVYQCCFSADSRLLVSSSKDTTLKVWDVKTGKLHTDLPGHQDEVFAVDWSPDGKKVSSGGKDKVSAPQTPPSPPIRLLTAGV